MSAKFSPPIRIANVSYLNSVPYRCLARLDWARYEECEPAECARKLHEDECDLALIPIAEYLANGRYQALRFGLASQGPVDSVFLFGERPVEELDQILLDTSSQTSVILLKVLLETQLGEKFGALQFRRADPETAAAGIKDRTGALIIGDRALKLRSKFLLQYDLGQEWLAQTGLPMIFAGWAGRPERISPPIVEALEQELLNGLRNKAIFARSWADEHSFDRQQAVKYIEGNIFHQLNERSAQAVAEYAERASRLKLLPKGGLSFFNGARSQATIYSALTGKPIPASAPKSGSEALFAAVQAGARLSVAEALLLATEADLLDLAFAVMPLGAPPALTPPTIRPAQHSGDLPVSMEELAARIAGDSRSVSAIDIASCAAALNFTAEQILHDLLKRGLSALEWDGGELLIDRLRKKDRAVILSTADWIGIHRSAHHLGISTTAGIAVGRSENWNDRLNHLHKIRQLQDETGGFSSFICFKEPGYHRRSSEDFLRTIAIARLFLDNFDEIMPAGETTLAEISAYFGGGR